VGCVDFLHDSQPGQPSIKRLFHRRARGKSHDNPFSAQGIRQATTGRKWAMDADNKRAEGSSLHLQRATIVDNTPAPLIGGIT